MTLPKKRKRRRRRILSRPRWCPETPKKRSGFFLYRRDFFQEVETRCGGASARYFMTDLVDDAAYEPTEFTLSDGSVIRLEPSDVVVPIESMAAGLRISPASAWRILNRLQSECFIRKRPARWLKNGKGRAPTIVTVLNYGIFRDRTMPLPSTDESTPEKKEAKEPNTPKGKLLYLDGAPRRETDSRLADCGERPEDVLNFYRSKVRVDCDERRSFDGVSAAITTFGANKVIAAVRNPEADRMRERAEDFFEPGSVALLKCLPLS